MTYPKLPKPTKDDLMPAMRDNDHTRRRMSLNLANAEYAVIADIAREEHCSIHEAIRRSANTRWRIHTAHNPALRFPDLAPEDLPEPEHIAFIGDRSGRVREVEIL